MNQLYRIRTDRNLKQTDIANIIGRNITTVSMIENYRQNLTEDQIIKICKKLNISADELLGLN